jgi:hypothetical protein
MKNIKKTLPRRCGEVLFDEEIMAGWSPEDSNLNTRCLFCQAHTVPSLTIHVLDFRCDEVLRLRIRDPVPF